MSEQKEGTALSGCENINKGFGCCIVNREHIVLNVKNILILVLAVVLLIGAIGVFKFMSGRAALNSFNEGLNSYSAGDYAEAASLFEKVYLSVVVFHKLKKIITFIFVSDL